MLKINKCLLFLRPAIKIKSPSKTLILLILVIANLILFSYIGFIIAFKDHIYPGVKIAGIDLSRKTPSAAKDSINSAFNARVKEPLKFQYQGQEFSLDVSKADPEINLDEKIDEAFNTGRSGDYLEDFRDQLQALTVGINLAPKLTYKKPASLIYEINQINRNIKKDPQDAELIFAGTVNIKPSEEGLELDNETLMQQIGRYLIFSSSKPVFLPIKTTQPSFETANAEVAKTALEYVNDAPIVLHYGSQAWHIDQPTLFSLLDMSSTSFAQTAPIEPTGVIGKNIVPDKRLLISEGQLSNYLKTLSAIINQEAQDARFNFDPSAQRVQEFQPAQEGRELDIAQTATLLAQALTTNPTKSIELPVKVTKPKIMTADANTFGIKDLLGRGVSNFTGSIENRIYNLKLASARINGTLIPPGENFSFNKTVGEISGVTGYKPAYVIKSGRTVLDDGGGVCQVSTTLFRAVLNAGLPIVERTAHAYRVGYYEIGSPPGLDATVFSPTVDFKFKNDTSSYILVQAYVSGSTLYFDLYGTSDGRVATVTTPKINSQTPPPPELRQDDPTLQKGQVKQVDWAAWGANVSFNRTVSRNGETIIQETWKSFYKPWQAVYLVGTKE